MKVLGLTNKTATLQAELEGLEKANLQLENLAETTRLEEGSIHAH